MHKQTKDNEQKRPTVLSKVWLQIRDIWSRRERGIIWWLAALLVGVVAFEAGFIQGRAHQDPPLVIEKPAEVSAETCQSQDQSAEKTNASAPSAKIAAVSPSTFPSDCRFVGSKNSDKYHAPSCAVAKRIKPENRVCFASEEDAQKRGYQAGCLK